MTTISNDDDDDALSKHALYKKVEKKEEEKRGIKNEPTYPGFSQMKREYNGLFRIPKKEILFIQSFFSTTAYAHHSKSTVEG